MGKYDDDRIHTLQFRCTEDDLETLRQGAELAGHEHHSTWVREVALKDADRRSKDPAAPPRVLWDSAEVMTASLQFRVTPNEQKRFRYAARLDSMDEHTTWIRCVALMAAEALIEKYGETT